MTPNFLKVVYIVVDDKIKGEKDDLVPRNLSYADSGSVCMGEHHSHFEQKLLKSGLLLFYFCPFSV